MSEARPPPSARAPAERGSIFTVLLGALAVSAALSVATYQLMSGPVATMARVTKKTMADTQMISASRIIIMDAVNQAAGGDCDNDGSVEPREWRTTAGAKPTNAGLIPLTIGAPVTDPWNTDYGYCVWDVGAQNDPAVNNGCGAGAKRLKGSPTPVAGSAVTQTVLAVISAGPNRQFQTTCNAYVDATTDEITAGGDDVIMRFTYTEAASATSALWFLKTGAPTTATINKDIEIGSTAAITMNQTSGNIIATGGIKPGTQATVTACAAGTNVGMIRYNSVTPGLEVCNGASGWQGMGGSVAGADKQVQYNANGVLSAESNFNWDYTNHRLGIGTAGPLKPLDAVGDIANQKYSNTASDGSHLFLFRARGTQGGAAAVQASDRIGGVEFYAHDGTNGWNTVGLAGAIRLFAAENFTAAAHGSRLSFRTVPLGSTTITEQMVIDPAGNVGIGTSIPGEMLSVQKDQNASTTALVTNATSGTGATANFRAVSNGGAKFEAGMLSPGFTAIGALVPSSSYVYTDGSAGLGMMANNATGTIRFATGGTAEKVRIDAAGNVGIGETSPSTSLAVKGIGHFYPSGTTPDDNYNGALRITKPAASGQYLNLIRAANYPWSIGTVYNSNTFAIGPGQATDANFTSPYLAITTTGTVGIGTTSPRAVATGFGLDATGSLAFTNGANVGAIDFTAASWTTSGGGVVGWNKTGGAGEMSLVSISGGGADGGFSFYDRNTQLVRILKNGNVGIGTTTPAVALTIGATNIATVLPGAEFDIGVAAGANYALTRLGQDTTHNAYFAWYADAVAASAHASVSTWGGNNPLILQEAGGNVGIGISPGSKLDVKGTLRLSGSASGYVGFAPAAAAGSTTYTLPSADGSAGYALATNGSGTLSWASVAATGGGTGLTTYAQGDMIYASAANTLARLAKDANATRYLSNTGASNNPAWAQVNLANGVTGVLASASGSNSNYGSLTVQGEKSGWSGISFRNAAGTLQKTLMITSTYSGIYNSSDNGWDWYWTNGTLTAGTVPAANLSGGTAPGSYTFSTDARAPIFYDSDNTAYYVDPAAAASAIFAGYIKMNNTSPTLYFQDSDNYSGMIHVNSSLMYFLSGCGVNSGSWCLNGSYWPLTINMTNDDATFGGNLYVAEGNIGVGTAGPVSYKLQAQGDIYANGGWLRVSGNQGLYFESWGGGWYMQDGTWIRSYNSKPVYMSNGYDSGSPSGVGCGGGLGGGYMFQVCGQIFADSWVDRNNAGYYVDPSWVSSVNQLYSGAFFYNSDRRLKENIRPIEDPLGKVLALRGVSFNWKKDKKKDIGFVAQEVEKVLPEVVSSTLSPVDHKQAKSVEYGNIVALAVEAIKSLFEKITGIEARLHRLEAENAEMRLVLCELKPAAKFCGAQEK